MLLKSNEELKRGRRSGVLWIWGRPTSFNRVFSTLCQYECRLGRVANTRDVRWNAKL